MLFGFLVSLFVFVCFLLVLIILIQQGKGSMGLGALGGGTQMLFGGSGGQDIFQKITWTLGAIFMFGSLVLALMKSTGGTSSRYVRAIPASRQEAPVRKSMPAPTPGRVPTPLPGQGN
ncbi:preprotein translocase subunit SecG [Candidatus Dependentiae bacterium]